MRALRDLLSVAVVLLFLGPVTACEKGPVVVKSPDMQQSLFLINGLATQQGVQTIKSALRRVRGVTKVVMDLPNAEALVTFDANLANDMGLEQAIEGTGYPAHRGAINAP